jgi:hypothetical protein
VLSFGAVVLAVLLEVATDWRFDLLPLRAALILSIATVVVV